MNAIHKILVPTDFSAHADEAFRVAHCPVMVVKAPAHQAAPPLVHAPSSPGTTKAEDGHAG
jgi:hypothetical protein